jgi:hypothetical protein
MNIKNEDKHVIPFIKRTGKVENTGVEGYPLYPANEDIYNKAEEEKDINPEDISVNKALNQKGTTGKNNEKDFVNDKSGNDLDIPGSDLDDIQENIGSEDEENNYYSLGGDDHDDLDEDAGE